MFFKGKWEIMQELNSWILSICGISVISLLAEIVLPNGKTNKLIKSVLALVSVSIIIYPLKIIDFNNLNFNSILNNAIVIDTEFVENRNNEKIIAFEKEIELNLSNNGYVNTKISISGFFQDEKLLIDKVFVDLRNCVLNDKNLNIDKYTNIVAIIKNIIDVKKEYIVFYE